MKHSNTSHYTRLSSPTQQQPHIPRPRPTAVSLWYALYGFTVLLIAAAALIFWSISAARPILFSVSAGEWLTRNQNYATIACTIAGTLLASWTIWLLNSLLVLMSKQVISSRGTTISVVEVWHRMFNKDWIADKKRVHISLLTLAFWIVVLYLATAYTALITPVNVLLIETVTGSEIDFNSQEFWDWYNYQDEDRNFNRSAGTGCHWTTFNNSRGSTTFPTCLYNNDPVNFLQAGYTSAQRGLSIAQNPAINYLDKHFRGSTGGTLPYGWAGFGAFSDLQFDRWGSDVVYTTYNYSLSQQGLTADVACEITSDSPITSTHISYLDNTILGLPDGRMNYVNFTWTCPPNQTVASSGQITTKAGTAQIVTPQNSWATLVVCQAEPPTLHEYTVYIGAFGTYATDRGEPGVASFFPNMTCSMKPMLTNVSLAYTSTGDIFDVNHTAIIPDSGRRVPNETYQAIDRAFSLAISNSENMVIDSIHGFAAVNNAISYPKAMELTLQGYIEMFATNLRMYYSANEPPGRRTIRGNYTTWRVGYNGDPVVLGGLLPPLLFICGLAIAYTVIGLRTGLQYIPEFDPVNSVSMLAASAAGGTAGKFPIPDFGLSQARDRTTIQTSIKYDRVNGYIVTTATTSRDTAVVLEELRSGEVSGKTDARPVTPEHRSTSVDSAVSL